MDAVKPERRKLLRWARNEVACFTCPNHACECHPEPALTPGEGSYRPTSFCRLPGRRGSEHN